MGSSGWRRKLSSRRTAPVSCPGRSATSGYCRAGATDPRSAGRNDGSAFCSRYGARSPCGCGELGGTTIPPCLRQGPPREGPCLVFQAGPDVDGPNEVFAEPFVLGPPARRRVLPPWPASEPAWIGLPIPLV